MKKIMSYDKLLKLVLIGDERVGKQTLRNRYSFELDKDELSKIYNLPSGIQVYGKDVELNDVGMCRIHIWELGGGKISRSLLPN